MTVFDYHLPTDQDQGGPDDQMRLAIQKRKDENDKTVMAILASILRKNRDSLTIMDKAFLQARSSYMTEAERDAYKDVLEENLNGVEVPHDVEVIKEVKEPEPTRAELEAQATALGIENPGDRKLYPTNKTLKEAVLAAQG